MDAACPVCGGTLSKQPQRKTKCPHCGDYLYVKYRPDESRDSRRVVGSVEAAEIEQLWDAHNELERLARHASYQTQRELIIERLRSQKLPDSVVAYFVRIWGPLRHGDCFEAISCNDRSTEWRIVDLNTMQIHRIAHPGKQYAPIDGFPKTVVNGCAVECENPETHYVKRCWLELMADRTLSWRIKARDFRQVDQWALDYWQACRSIEGFEAKASG